MLFSHFPETAIHFDQLNVFTEQKDLEFYAVILLSASFSRCPGSVLILHISMSLRMKIFMIYFRCRTLNIKS